MFLKTLLTPQDEKPPTKWATHRTAKQLEPSHFPGHATTPCASHQRPLTEWFRTPLCRFQASPPREKPWDKTSSATLPRAWCQSCVSATSWTDKTAASAPLRAVVSARCTTSIIEGLRSRSNESAALHVCGDHTFMGNILQRKAYLAHDTGSALTTLPGSAASYAFCM